MLERRCAVVGHPVAHSLSPALHQAGYAAVGLDWRYEAIDVAPGTFADFVASLDPSWRGLSVTMPHKKDAARLGEPDEMTSLLGVANTLVFGRSVRCYNTDVGGFVYAMRVAGRTQVDSAIILGNGATASSVLAGLAKMKARTVTVIARSIQRASALVRLGRALDVDVSVIGINDPWPHADVFASVIPESAAAPHASRAVEHAQVIFDAIYDPWPTALSVAASQANLGQANGLDLLVGQAVGQFELMTSYSVSADVLASAGQNALLLRGH